MKKLTHFQRSGGNFKFIFFSTKTYDVGTQKSHLNETALLSTYNICKEKLAKENYGNFTFIIFAYLDLVYALSIPLKGMN